MSDNIASDLVNSHAASVLEDRNYLFPVFIKLENLSLLIVGGGYVGMEKLNVVLQNSPAANIRLVATTISDDIKRLVDNNSRVELIERPYQSGDIDAADLVIAAVNDITVSEQVSRDARQKGKLINAADRPDLRLLQSD